MPSLCILITPPTLVFKSVTTLKATGAILTQLPVSCFVFSTVPLVISLISPVVDLFALKFALHPIGMEILIHYLLLVFKAALLEHTEITHLIDFVFLNAITRNTVSEQGRGNVWISALLELGENPIRCHVQLSHTNA